MSVTRACTAASKLALSHCYESFFLPAPVGGGPQGVQGVMREWWYICPTLRLQGLLACGVDGGVQFHMDIEGGAHSFLEDVPYPGTVE